MNNISALLAGHPGPMASSRKLTQLQANLGNGFLGRLEWKSLSKKDFSESQTCTETYFGPLLARTLKFENRRGIGKCGLQSCWETFHDTAVASFLCKYKVGEATKHGGVSPYFCVWGGVPACCVPLHKM